MHGCCRNNNAAGDDRVAAFKGDLGNQSTGAAGIEAALDIEYIMGVAPHVKTEFFRCSIPTSCPNMGNDPASGGLACAYGHENSTVLCGGCREGFAHGLDGFCTECDSQAGPILTLLAFLLCAVGVLLTIIRSTLRARRQRSAKLAASKIG